MFKKSELLILAICLLISTGLVSELWGVPRVDSDSKDAIAFNGNGPDSDQAKQACEIISMDHQNPTNPTARLSFELTEAQNVRLDIYDASGSLVRTLIDGYCPAGVHKVVFDASNRPSGVYFARIIAGNAMGVSKLIILR